MASTDVGDLVRRWSEQFRKDPIAAGVVIALRDRADEIWQHAFDLLKGGTPEYRNAVDAEFTGESKAHCNELLRMIVAIAARRVDHSGTDPFDFVRTHAQWRARRQVPLIASLAAYRLAHRTYWELTHKALPQHAKKQQAIRALTMLSDFWIEFFDHVGAVLADTHALEESLIVAQSTRTHEALVDGLLRGQEPQDAGARRLCALCGIRASAPTAVFIARPLPPRDGQQFDIEAQLRSLGRLVEQALPPATFGKLLSIRNNEITAIVCGTASTSRSLVQALRRGGFARRAEGGRVVRIGVSQDAAEWIHIPTALEEARLALEFTTATQPLMHFSDIDLSEFLVRRADSAAIRLIPEWALQFKAENGASRELYRTVVAFADCNFNVKQTAQRLRIHTNTVYFRLNRIKKLTGIDPRTYAGTSRLLTALQLLEVHDTGVHRR
jgi:sugar diacid utilization regulator